jgi:hypothetical protein
MKTTSATTTTSTTSTTSKWSWEAQHGGGSFRGTKEECMSEAYSGECGSVYDPEGEEWRSQRCESCHAYNPQAPVGRRTPSSRIRRLMARCGSVAEVFRRLEADPTVRWVKEWGFMASGTEWTRTTYRDHSGILVQLFDRENVPSGALSHQEVVFAWQESPAFVAWDDVGVLKFPLSGNNTNSGSVHVRTGSAHLSYQDERHLRGPDYGQLDVPLGVLRRIRSAYHEMDRETSRRVERGDVDWHAPYEEFIRALGNEIDLLARRQVSPMDYPAPPPDGQFALFVAPAPQDGSLVNPVTEGRVEAIGTRAYCEDVALFQSGKVWVIRPYE